MSELIRTQILLDKKQKVELDEIAREEGKSISELVRSYLNTQLRQEKYTKMRRVAEELENDYMSGSELTATTSLDAEDFIDAAG